MAQNHQLTERESFFSCCIDQPGSNFSDQKRCEARTTVHSAWPGTRGCAKCPKMEVSLQAAVSFLQEADDRGPWTNYFQPASSRLRRQPLLSSCPRPFSLPLSLATVSIQVTVGWRQTFGDRLLCAGTSSLVPSSRPCLRLSWRKPGVFLTPPQPLLWLTFPFSSSLKTQSAHHGVYPDPPGVGTAAKRAGQEQ